MKIYFTQHPITTNTHIPKVFTNPNSRSSRIFIYRRVLLRNNWAQLSYVNDDNIVVVIPSYLYTAFSISKEPMTPPARYFNQKMYEVKVRRNSRRLVKFGVLEAQLSYVNDDDIVEVIPSCLYTAFRSRKNK